MSKYAPLQNHLESLSKDSWKAKFSEIENIVGFALPNSAHNHRAWWANDSQNGRHWKAVGWKTGEVNFGNETVMFYRQEESLPTPMKKRSAPPVKDTIPCLWDKPYKMECRIVMEWQPLGTVTQDQQGRLLFPKAQSIPAIYRLRIRYVQSEAGYIGETDNLSRRFGNYRNPGSTQQTSLRINAVLKQALDKGAEIAVSAVTTQAWIDRGNGLEAVSFTSKAMRCLFENAAILDNGGTDIDMLNRAST